MEPPTEHGGVSLQGEDPSQGEYTMASGPFTDTPPPYTRARVPHEYQHLFKEDGVFPQGKAPLQVPYLVTTGPFPISTGMVPYKRAVSHEKEPLSQDDGDVVIYVDTPYFDVTSETTEFTVSGAILAAASPIFREILSGPNAHHARSVADPQILKLDDWRKYTGLAYVCHILHGLPYIRLEEPDFQGFLSLLQFAQSAKEWRMVEYMKPTISPRLLAPFLQRSTAPRTEKTFRTATDLVAIAYLLDQKEQFELFTRRLIMDHCRPLNTCADDLFHAHDLFDVVPAQAICKLTFILKAQRAKANLTFLPVYLADQRTAAQNMITEMLRKAATTCCSVCGTWSYDRLLTDQFGQKLRPPVVMWPPFSRGYHTLRDILAALDSFPGFRARGKICHDESKDFFDPEDVRRRCKEIADTVNKRLVGLCLTCVKEARPQVFCKHHDAQLFEKDPLA